MSTVNSLMAKNIGNAMSNMKTWSMVYNVLEEGLRGGGTIDDTVALQTLVNKAIAAGRRTIFFPHGENGQYCVTALSNADQVDFIGDNAVFIGGYSGTISGMGSDAALKADFEAHESKVGTTSDLGHHKVDGITIGEAAGVLSARAALKVAGELSISNSTIETAIASYTIPGGTLGGDGGIEFKIGGRLFNGGAVNRSVIIRIKLGSTIIASATLTVAGVAAQSYGISIDGLLINQTVNSQRMMAKIYVTNAGTATLLPGTQFYATRANAVSSENTATDKVFQVTAELTEAVANWQIVRDLAFMKFLGRV